jgi:hypothetical protein
MYFSVLLFWTPKVVSNMKFLSVAPKIYIKYRNKFGSEDWIMDIWQTPKTGYKNKLINVNSLLLFSKKNVQTILFLSFSYFGLCERKFSFVRYSVLVYYECYDISSFILLAQGKTGIKPLFIFRLVLLVILHI